MNLHIVDLSNSGAPEITINFRQIYISQPLTYPMIRKFQYWAMIPESRNCKLLEGVIETNKEPTTFEICSQILFDINCKKEKENDNAKSKC